MTTIHNPSLHSHSLWKICHNFCSSVVWSLYSSEGWTQTWGTQHSKCRKGRPILWSGTGSSSGSIFFLFIHHLFDKEQFCLRLQLRTQEKLQLSRSREDSVNNILMRHKDRQLENIMPQHQWWLHPPASGLPRNLHQGPGLWNSALLSPPSSWLCYRTSSPCWACMTPPAAGPQNIHLYCDGWLLFVKIFPFVFRFRFF